MTRSLRHFGVFRLVLCGAKGDGLSAMVGQVPSSLEGPALITPRKVAIGSMMPRYADNMEERGVDYDI